MECNGFFWSQLVASRYDLDYRSTAYSISFHLVYIKQNQYQRVHMMSVIIHTWMTKYVTFKRNLRKKIDNNY